MFHRRYLNRRPKNSARCYHIMHIARVCERLQRLQIQHRISRSFRPRNPANLRSKVRFWIRRKEHTLSVGKYALTFIFLQGWIEFFVGPTPKAFVLQCARWSKSFAKAAYLAQRDVFVCWLVYFKFLFLCFNHFSLWLLAVHEFKTEQLPLADHSTPDRVVEAYWI